MPGPCPGAGSTFSGRRTGDQAACTFGPVREEAHDGGPYAEHRKGEHEPASRSRT
jgi:hypothetical protein